MGGERDTERGGESGREGREMGGSERDGREGGEMMGERALVVSVNEHSRLWCKSTTRAFIPHSSSFPIPPQSSFLLIRPHSNVLKAKVL